MRILQAGMVPATLRALLFVSSVLQAGWLTAEVPTKIHGWVVMDANANGQLDPGEEGMPGVAVTDAVQIVETNEKGEWKCGN